MSESTVTQKKSLFAAGLSHICQDGLGASTYVLLPILAEVFGFSYAQVGAIKGAKNLALGLFELVSGLLSERFGECRVLVIGLLIAGVGYALLAATNTATLVICCLIVVGIGGGLQHAPASTLVSNAYDYHTRRSALGLYNSSGDVGKLLFSACFSIAIAIGIEWQQVVFSYGLFTVLAAMVVGFTLSVHRPMGRTNTGSTIHNGHQSAHGWGVLNVTHFSLLLVVVFLDNVVQVGVLVFVAFLMIAKELPLFLATVAAAMVLVGGVFGKAGCGYLAERIGIRRAFVLVQLLTAIGLLSIVAAPGWLAFAMLLPFGVVSQGSTSITYGLLPDYIHPERMARGYSILYSSTSIAAAAGPWLVGLTADSYSLGFAFELMAVVALLSLVPFFLSSDFAKTR
jgi:MFS family permease